VPQSYLIRNATLLEKGHSLHSEKIDILIVNGKIAELGKSIKSDVVLIEGEDLIVSSGWIDLRCHLSDPGNEHKDSLGDTLNSAAAGGFTTLVTLPHSEPAIENKSSVNYLVKSAQDHIVDLMPTGVLSSSENYENLAELYDMYNAGSVAFTNGDNAVSNGLLKKALLYTKPFGAIVISHASDKSLEQKGVVNESETTIHTGLKTSSSLAEYISVREQIEVAKYCDAPLHFSCISTKESVALIKQAKKEGAKITCDVAIASLCFTDKEILSFDENFKLYPPLRTEKDRKALIKGLNDGTIDAICSNHCPQNIESKLVEFDYADFGSLSLQLMLSWYLKHLASDISMELFVSSLTSGPGNVLENVSSTVNKGDSANLIVVDMKAKWTFDASTNKSSSKNSHEWKKEQVGKVIAVFNNNKINFYN